MPKIADQLRQYATAIADPTRGMILVELNRAGELTGTQIAKRLDLTVNNVYHHLRVMRQLGVIDPPRIVPGDTYVEKYYSINPELRASLRLDPEWYTKAQEALDPEDQQAVVVGVLLTMALLLRRTAQDYQDMDAADLNRHLADQRLAMFSMNQISRAQLRFRVGTVRNVLDRADRQFAEDLSPRTDVMLIAALPSLANGVNAPED
jgi:DNA-binding transcriptional ArsR family regulator